MGSIKEIDGVLVGSDTIHVHSLETVPLALVAVALTIHVPCFTFALIYIASVTLTLD